MNILIGIFSVLGMIYCVNKFKRLMNEAVAGKKKQETYQENHYCSSCVYLI